MTMKPFPLRGDIWTLNLDPTKGREQAGYRLCLVLSVDDFNEGPADLVLIMPLTSRERKIPLHVAVSPPEGGLVKKSFVMCEAIRSISKERLIKKLGSLSNQTLAKVEDCLRILLSL